MLDTYTAFAGLRRLATGTLDETILGAKSAIDAGETAPVLVFEDRTGTQLDFDWRGTPDDVRRRLASHPHFAAPVAAPEDRTSVV